MTEESGPWLPLEADLAAHLEALRGLHEVSRRLTAARDLMPTLQLVVDTVVDSLGFGVAVINLVRGDVIEVAAIAGPEDVRQALEGQSGPRSAWDELIASARSWGALRYLRGDAATLPHDVPSWTPPDGTDRSADQDRWRPDDALFAPLYSPREELVGIISVDLPASGRMPGPLQRDLLELFVAQAAVAVDNARLHSELLRTMGRLEREHRALGASEESFRQAFENAPSGMAMADMRPGRDPVLLRVNAALCELLGRSSGDLSGQRLSEIAHPDDRAALPVGASEPARADVRLRQRDGRVIWTSLSSSVIAGVSAVPRLRLIHVEDISERRDRELQLAHRATHDPLTGLHNRTELLSRLGECVDEGAGVVVLFCDLDHFKQVNDRYGHDAGDAVLVEVARRLRHMVRRRDLVSRIGGEEFVLVLREATRSEAEVLARRLDAEVRRPIRHGDLRILVTLSIGIASSDPRASVDELLRSADAAMYRAKATRAGR